MRILWHSNAPWVGSGYGRLTNDVVPRLLGLGHKVTISSFYGLEGSPQKVTYPQGEVWVYPKSRDRYGNDTLAADARYLNADIVITNMDAWTLSPIATQQVRWCPWFPVDRVPVPDDVLDALPPAFYPMVYSKFGQEQLKEAGIEAAYIPCGVDTKVFRPENKVASKERIGCPKDAFLVGIVAANITRPSRKCFIQQLAAFKLLHDKHNDAVLYLHTNFNDYGKGEPISKIIQRLDIPREAIAQPDQYRYARGMFDTEYMHHVYSAMDILLNVTRGEGFGLPIIEAQACGTPVIVTNSTSMPELVGAGLLVEVDEDDKYLDQDSWQYVPKPSRIAEQLEMAYQSNAAQRQLLSLAARRWAFDEYDADHVMETYWKPALEKMEQNLTAPKVYRVLVNGVTLTLEDDPVGGVVPVIAHEVNAAYGLGKLDLKPGDVILDIGGHVGVVSTYLGLRYPDTRIITYEPVRENYDRLVKNLEENGVKNVTAINKAVTGDGQPVTINLSLGTNTGGNSAYTKSNGHGQQEVESVTLDQIFEEHRIDRIALLKMDCEGAEYEILKASRQLSRVDRLRAEFHYNGILTAKGYKPAELDQYCEQYIQDVIVFPCQISE